MKGFAGGLAAIRDGHPWAIPWRAPFSRPGRALGVRGGPGSLEANLEMSRDYEVKKKKKKEISQENNNNASKHREMLERDGSEYKNYFRLWSRFKDIFLNLNT